MKGTELFKQIIKEHLDKKAQKDESFSRSYSKKGKNIDDCVTYILNLACWNSVCVNDT